MKSDQGRTAFLWSYAASIVDITVSCGSCRPDCGRVISSRPWRRAASVGGSHDQSDSLAESRARLNTGGFICLPGGKKQIRDTELLEILSASRRLSGLVELRASRLKDELEKVD
jgi:hypothetical protein